MKNMSKKMTAFLLAAVLCFTLIPAGNTAAEIMPVNGDISAEEDRPAEGGSAFGVSDQDALTDTDNSFVLTDDAGDTIEENAEDETSENGSGDQEDLTEKDPADENPAVNPGEDSAQEGFAEDSEDTESAADPEGEESDDESESSDDSFAILEPMEEESVNPSNDETEELLDANSSIELASVTLPYSSCLYKGKKINQTPVVTAIRDGQEIVLEKGVDYTVAYKNNLNVGTASVIVTGIGNYTGSKTVKFKIKPVSIGSVTKKYSKKTYTGKAITQTKTTVVKAKVNGQEKVLTLGTDYTISYENNKKVGTASLIVTGTGNFKGSISEEFKIIPRTPTVLKISPGTKKFTVKWEAQSEETSGFQIQYCESEDFSTEKTTVTVRDPSAVSETVSDMALGTYYIRFRAYTRTGGAGYYSKWTETKKMKLFNNMLVISGSGAKKTVYLHNPKSSVKNPAVAIWSKAKGQDDLQWYDMKKYSDGSWRAAIPVAWLNDYGICYAHCYNGDAYLRGKAFTVTESDFEKTKNTIDRDGDGVLSTIYLLHPAKAYQKVRAAVWSEENGQDDLEWITMTKKSSGYWSTDTCLSNILNSGTVHVHVYAGTTRFLGAYTFNVKFGMEPCSSEEEYIEKIAPAVQRVCKKYGYLPSVLIAQSCLENGYGIPSYWDNPEICGLIYYNNMVGLKSELLSSSWEDYTVWGGKSISKKTPEVYDGQSVIITDSFRVYDSIEQSFADYLLFMTYASNYGPGGKPKYGQSVLSITNPSELIKAVAKRGYATGSTYPTSVIRIIRTHDLTKYDDLSKVKPTSYGP